MPNQTTASNEVYRIYVGEIMSQCETSSNKLYAEAERVRRLRSMFDLILIGFAVSAFAVLLVSSIETFPVKVGQGTSTLITFGSALAVIAQSSFDRILFKDDPQRIKDWAFYIGNYVTRVNSELAEPEPNWERIRVLVDQANLNLDAGEKEWKQLVDTARTPPAHRAL